jgi:hypothetical protein
MIDQILRKMTILNIGAYLYDLGLGLGLALALGLE